MISEKIQYDFQYGVYGKVAEDNKSLKQSRDLFGEHLFASTTIKSIKMWFGTPKEGMGVKTILGMKVDYINYMTGEQKSTEYQGANIDYADVEVQELEISEGHYLSKMEIAFKDYIYYIKLGTGKKFIEFGKAEPEEKIKGLKELNEHNNIILNLKGNVTSDGIRALGCDYIERKYFLLNRCMDLFRLRHKIQKDKEFKEKYQNGEFNKLNEEMKFFYNICKLADTPFSNILKYL